LAAVRTTRTGAPPESTRRHGRRSKSSTRPAETTSRRVRRRPRLQKNIPPTPAPTTASKLPSAATETPRNDRRLDRLLDEVKEREAQGYAYDGADASFELLARRALDVVPHYFDVISFRVMVEHRHNAKGELVTVSEAVVKVAIDGESFINAGEGNGPVNALDVALRKDLGKYQKHIADLELADYKVRILNGGTGATTRVLIESRDGKGERWFTVGVSPNIVDASFQALSDSIVFKLMKEGVTAS
jgi:2-isopropylmalate synthase